MLSTKAGDLSGTLRAPLSVTQRWAGDGGIASRSNMRVHKNMLSVKLSHPCFRLPGTMLANACHPKGKSKVPPVTVLQFSDSAVNITPLVMFLPHWL